MDFKTADLCDEFEQSVRVAEPLLRDYGGTASLHGSMVTVRVFEDNVLVREVLETDGQGRVLVVDGGGSTRCALVGDRLAQLAYDNGWVGIVVDGCIRDSVEISRIPVGVRAHHAIPKKSAKRGAGERDVPVRCTPDRTKKRLPVGYDVGATRTGGLRTAPTIAGSPSSGDQE